MKEPWSYQPPLDPVDAKAYFAARLSHLIDGHVNSAWAKRHGLSYGSVRDLVQGRVLPSRAMLILIHAIERSPGFMDETIRAARDDLIFLERARGADGR